MPEVRIDPLSGLRTIVASDRATRPGGGLSATAARSDRHRDGPVPRGPRGPHAARDLRAARQRRRARHARAGACASCPNLYPALDPGSAAAARRSPSPTCSRAAPARGAHEVVINAPDPVTSLADLEVEQVVDALDVWRERMRTHTRERRRLRARHRQRAPRGRRVAAPHPRADLRAGLRPRRRRPRARALRRLRAAHDGRQPAAGPRPGGGQAARADRRHRRRGGPHGPLRRAPALPAHARAARAARALRGRRPDRRGAAARRPAPPRAQARQRPAAEPLGAHRPARRRPLLLAHRHRAAPDPHGRPRARHRRAPEHRRARAGGRRAARGLRRRAPPECARSCSASRRARGARRRRDRRRDRRRGCSSCSASPTTTTRPSCDRLADKVRALRDLRRRRGPDERAARRPRGARRQPVHALRRRAQGQPPVATSPPRRPEHAEPLYERFAERLGARARRVRRA